MRTIGVGVIGMGWMEAAHRRAYRMVPDRFPQSEIQPRIVMCAADVEPRAIADWASSGMPPTGAGGG